MLQVNYNAVLQQQHRLHTMSDYSIRWRRILFCDSFSATKSCHRSGAISPSILRRKTCSIGYWNLWYIETFRTTFSLWIKKIRSQKILWEYLWHEIYGGSMSFSLYSRSIWSPSFSTQKFQQHSYEQKLLHTKIFSKTMLNIDVQWTLSIHYKCPTMANFIEPIWSSGSIRFLIKEALQLQADFWWGLQIGEESSSGAKPLDQVLVFKMLKVKYAFDTIESMVYG